VKVCHDIDAIKIENSCVAVGVFDGVHRGHRRVLCAASETARQSSGIAVALTFDRHPAGLLFPQKAPSYLTSLSQKIEYIEALGVIDVLVVVPFDLRFANMSPAQFVDRVLCGRLGAKHVRVGADFRYGKDRAGSVMDLEAAGEAHGFEVTIVHPITHDGERVSSTHIRSQVEAGRMQLAHELLGRPFAMRGQVGHGKKLGRTIGFPTVNLILEEPRYVRPVLGVYAGWAILPNRPRIPAAISIGTNPTTDGENNVVKVEAHLLDGFDEDVYDRTVDIAFHSHIRAEHRFADVDRLVDQLHRDITQVERRLIERA